jgi:hypothetical protein
VAKANQASRTPVHRNSGAGAAESPLADGLLRVLHTAPYRDPAFDGAAKISEPRVRENRNFGYRGHA